MAKTVTLSMEPRDILDRAHQALQTDQTNRHSEIRALVWTHMEPPKSGCCNRYSRSTTKRAASTSMIRVESHTRAGCAIGCARSSRSCIPTILLSVRAFFLRTTCRQFRTVPEPNRRSESLVFLRAVVFCLT